MKETIVLGIGQGRVGSGSAVTAAVLQQTFLDAGWVCARCGAKLPTAGLFWAARHALWLYRYGTSSGMYCDVCAGRKDGRYGDEQYQAVR